MDHRLGSGRISGWEMLLYVINTFVYNIAKPIDVTLPNVFNSFPPNLSWHRDLIGPKLAGWNDLFSHVAHFQLTQ
jgi:hypothetical protein